MQLSLLSQTKVILAVIPAVTIITLAIILVLLPRPPGNPCSEAKVVGMEFTTCSNEPPRMNEPGKTGKPMTDTPPRDGQVIEQSYNKMGSKKQTILDSIAGPWFVVGHTAGNTSTFTGSVLFGEANQLTTWIWLDGYLQNSRLGAYSYSPNGRTLTLDYVDSTGPAAKYKIDHMTKNSFRTVSPLETVLYVRK